MIFLLRLKACGFIAYGQLQQRDMAMNDWSIGTQAALILLREGLEAMLVIAALAAFLRRSGQPDRLKPLYAGAIAAIAASFGAAWVFETYFDGAHNDLFEACIMLLAATLLLYMSGWLFLRQNPKAWQAELQRAAERAVGAGTALSLAGIAFLAVFREGGETVLFLHTLARTSGGWSFGIFAGLAGAAMALAFIFVAMQWLALRLPLRPIFLATSAFLFVMGLKFVGEAIQELQEQVLVPIHDQGIPDMVYTLGLNGTWEALGAQAFVLLLALAGIAIASMRAGRASGSVPAAAE